MSKKESQPIEGSDSSAANEILFANLGLNEQILQAVTDTGYSVPTPIQAQTIPYVLQGIDVLGQAQTGTGKTAAFALPTLTLIDSNNKQTQVLVLAPTRELAIQVSEAFKTYSKHSKAINIACIYGGQDYKIQINALKKGAHVVVGTPGRVMDHIRRGTLVLDNLSTLVLDEADEMLRMGFIDDVEWILEKTPEQRQITLFSATMPREIKKITTKYLQDPVEVKIKTKTETASTINQRFLTVRAGQKMTALSRILEAEETDATIIFTRTKSSTVDVADFLSSQGFKSIAINGDLQQKQRERAIDQLKSGKLDILVATDVAARGLDVARISHVINYDAPQDNETYIHRIGRTGRAGRTGDAIIFVTPKEKRVLASIERTTKKSIDEFKMPSIDDINTKRIDHFKLRISRVLSGKDNNIFENIITDYCTENEASPTQVAAALAKISQGRKPLLLSPSDELQSNFQTDRGSESKQRGEPRKRGKSLPQDQMESYRVEVGRNHNVKPGNIVGAIANEAGLDGNLIGSIDIYDDYSVVSLPSDMPKSILEDLKKARIVGQKMNISSLGKAGTKHKVGGGKRRGSANKNSDNKTKPRRSRKITK